MFEVRYSRSQLLHRGMFWGRSSWGREMQKWTATFSNVYTRFSLLASMLTAVKGAERYPRYPLEADAGFISRCYLT